MPSTPSPADRAIVRDLAHMIAELAAREDNARICQRWRAVNALRMPDRAPVWCRPVGAWAELLPDSALACVDPRMRAIERGFRQLLIKRDIGDDEPIDPGYPVSAVFDVDPPNVWGVAVGRHASAEKGGAWAYAPPITSSADLERLRTPQFAYNAAKTQERLDHAHGLLGDILPVRRVGAPPLHSIIGNYLADLRGLGEMMLDMALEPAFIHRLTRLIADAVHAGIDAAEAAGVLTPNNDGPMTCSDPFGPPPVHGAYSVRNLWCMANSQEYDQVSPGMWEEFCLRYQQPIIERFGLSAYGCCENLTHKLDGVLGIRNLRIVVCSAWTSLDTVLEKVGCDKVIMWRQKASDVVFADAPERLRRDLMDGARRLRGRPYQIVLRELQTLAGHPDRLHVWTRLAKDAAAAG